MRRLACALSSLLVVLSLCAPAAAQIAGRRDYGPGGQFDPFLPDSSLPGPSAADEVGHIRKQINRLRDSGVLSRREARQLRREALRIGYTAHRYSRDGLSASERAELRARTAALRATVNRPRG